MMRIQVGKRFAVLMLCGMVVWTACSTAWIGEVEQIIAVMIPGIANLVTLGATLAGQEISNEDLQTVQSASSQAEADLQLLESLVEQYQKANVATQPGLLSQIQVEISAVQANLSGLPPALHIKDAATQEKITAIVGVLLAEVQSVAEILPKTSGAASRAKIAFSTRTQMKAALSAKGFVDSYNAEMTAKTGEARLDRTSAGLEIHLHGKAVRWATAGILK